MAWVPSSLKQATTSRHHGIHPIMAARPAHHLIHSSHSIPVMERLACHLVGSSRHASRAGVSHDMPLGINGTGRTKQASEHENPDGKTGRETGEPGGAKNRNEHNKKTTEMERRRNEDGKQASNEGKTRTYDAITHKNNASHHSRPTPSPWALVGSPASINSPAPRAWDERMRMS